jgi:two-component system response regulator NreC
MKIRVLLADDHAILRKGLRDLIDAEPDMEVIGEATDGEQAFKMARQLLPDLVVMDISMPDISGMEALPIIKKSLPECSVLMFTVHEDEGLLKKAIQAGASGYVVKRAAETELVNAIRTVMQGNIYIHPTMTRSLLQGFSSRPASKHSGSIPLTARELEVLQLLARGYTNNQIAEQLSISPRTVEGHRSNLMGKLNLNSRVEIVEYAEQHGLLD